MFIPLVIVFGCIFWFAMTWLKWYLIKSDSKKYQMDEELLKVMKGTPGDEKAVAEAMKRFENRKKAEQKVKIEASSGKTLFDEVLELRTRPKRRPSPKYTADMFEDPISRLKDKLDKEAKDKKQSKGHGKGLNI